MQRLDGGQTRFAIILRILLKKMPAVLLDSTIGITIIVLWYLVAINHGICKGSGTNCMISTYHSRNHVIPLPAPMVTKEWQTFVLQYR